MVQKNKFNIDKELMDQKNEIDDINYKLTRLTETILDKYPKHFGIRNVIDSLFAALLVGLTFILKGATVRTALNLKLFNVISILIFTLIIILLQVYFVSYSRVRSREERPVVPFIAKRMISIVLVSIFVSLLLIYLLGINNEVGSFDGIMKVTLLLSSITAIGSAIPGLMIKY
jgi:uncharacterized membrane protein